MAGTLPSLPPREKHKRETRCVYISSAVLEFSAFGCGFALRVRREGEDNHSFSSAAVKRFSVFCFGYISKRRESRRERGGYRVKGEIVKEFKQENCSYTYLPPLYVHYRPDQFHLISSRPE